MKDGQAKGDSPEVEFFDVVDENDRVVEVLPRSEVHCRGLRHRAVHIFLFRSDGRMLIHLRAADKEEFPSVWTSSASGHVSAGDHYAETANRELYEELGVQTQLSRVAGFAACPDTCNEFTELFVGTCDDSLTVDPVEIADTRWAFPDEIDAEMAEQPGVFSPAFRLLFADFQGRDFSALSQKPAD